MLTFCAFNFRTSPSNCFTELSVLHFFVEHIDCKFDLLLEVIPYTSINVTNVNCININVFLYKILNNNSPALL